MTAQNLPVCPASDLFLRAAYQEALDSYREGGIPIGAVLVADGEIIGRGHNRRVQEGNPILHGEMSAYRDAGRLPSAKYRRATLYTTRSPCSMCAGTTLLYGVPRIVIGEARPMDTAVGTRWSYLNSGKTGPEFLAAIGIDVTVIDDEACVEILRRFAREQPEVWAEDTGTVLSDKRA